MNYCFILSSIGGPKLLSPLLNNNFRKDVSYFIFQRMPSEEYLDVLIKCLREEIPHRIEYLEKDTKPEAGIIYILSNNCHFKAEHNLIKACPIESDGHYNLGINSLLLSVAQSEIPAALIILSGIMVEKDGLDGIKALKQKGAKVMATSRQFTPVAQMIDDLDEQSLIDDFLPPTSLLANLDFQPEASGHASQKWLVVDDEENVRDVIGDILSIEDIESDFAKDGLEALSKIQKSRYSALILDIKMPELNGLQTLEALETIEPNIPILIITGFDDDETRLAAKRPNVMGILLKPFMGENLLKYVAMVAEKGA